MGIKKILAALLILIIIGPVVVDRIAQAAPDENVLVSTMFSCARPSNAEGKARCSDLEDQILDSTVRIVLNTWGEKEGQPKLLTTEAHATILAGKYLVTHNHYRYSLRQQVEAYGDQSGYTGVSLYTSNGRLLLDDAGLDAFTIAYEDPEVLVLAFIDQDGQGFFEAANLPSAQFVDMYALPLREGLELAQVDWDGQKAHVDWVRVENLLLGDVIPQLQVGNFPLKGSSGGGVFQNGVHIGINWMRNTKINQETGEITGHYSTVILNASALVSLME